MDNTIFSTFTVYRWDLCKFRLYFRVEYLETPLVANNIFIKSNGRL